MIEPLLRLRQVYLMSGDSPQNFSAWAPNTVRIRKVSEETPPQRSQDALFLSLGICLCVQVCLPLQQLFYSLRIYIRLTLVGLFRIRLFQRLQNALTDLLQPVVELHLGLLLCNPEPSRDRLP